MNQNRANHWSWREGGTESISCGGSIFILLSIIHSWGAQYWSSKLHLVILHYRFVLRTIDVFFIFTVCNIVCHSAHGLAMHLNHMWKGWSIMRDLVDIFPHGRFTEFIHSLFSGENRWRNFIHLTIEATLFWPTWEMCEILSSVFWYSQSPLESKVIICWLRCRVNRG